MPAPWHPIGVYAKMKDMKNYSQLINNIVGQLNGIGKMMEDNRDCFEILAQSKAARAAIDSLMKKYIENESLNRLKNCRGRDKNQIYQKFLQELIKN